MPEKKNIEIRSEEVQEILGFIPHWIIRSGTGIFLVVILILFIGAWFIEYPDKLNSTITITTENPPASLIAKTSGKVDAIFIKDKQDVKEGEILAIIENSANYEHVLKLKQLLDSLEQFFSSYDTCSIQSINSTLSLGKIQIAYSAFINTFYEYKNFKDLDYYELKVSAIEKQLQQTKNQVIAHKRYVGLIKKELHLVYKQFIRDSNLYIRNVISPVQYEEAEKKYIQKKYAWETAQMNIINSQVKSSELEQAILENTIQQQVQQKELKVRLKSTYDELKSEIENWELKNVFRSPINGIVSFSEIWSKNQNINHGEIAFTIIPKEQKFIIGKLQLPITGSGKVRKGQKVIIKLKSYPYMEYGTIPGYVTSISLVPEKDMYQVTVDLPQNFITSYGKKLPFTQNMKGEAEVITKKISVLRRLFYPLKAYLNE